MCAEKIQCNEQPYSCLVSLPVLQFVCLRCLKGLLYPSLRQNVHASQIFVVDVTDYSALNLVFFGSFSSKYTFVCCQISV